MSTLFVGARLSRPLIFVLIGVALGALLVAPVLASDRGATKGNGPFATVTYSRSASCSGVDFYPTDSATDYSNAGPLRIRPSANGTGVFRCDPGLPTGAVVTKVQFTLNDHDSLGEVSGCNLVRSNLAAASAGGFNVMAGVQSTGVSETPNNVRYSQSSVAFPTVDNLKFGYWLECHLDDGSDQLSWTGLVGADVVYSISSTKG